jgi:CelD/BcsL family acetyltransferase involved in cellulose biosynthesis
MPVRLVTDDADFAALRPAWDRLAAGRTFRRYDWARAWWDAYGADRALRVLVAEDQRGEVVGIAPFGLERTLAHGRRLAIHGGGDACGDDMAPLVDPDHASAAHNAFAEWLTTGPGRGTWDTIVIDGASVADPDVDRFARGLSGRGVTLAQKPEVSRWAVDLPSTWSGFVETLGKRTRRLVRQLATRRETTPGLGLQWIGPGDAVDPWFDRLVELHNRRWESGACRGAFGRRGFEQFLRSTARGWHDRGALELVLLSVDGRAAAGAIGARTDRQLDLYLLGRDPEFDKLQVGWMLNLAVVENAIGRGLDRIDFLRGDEPYKEHLGCSPIAQHTVTLAAPGAINRLRRGARTLRTVAARVKRRLVDTA